MSLFLGIDTSNYTTSCAVYNDQTDEMVMRKNLLNVKSGEVGLRQSEAVFQHVVNLPRLMDQLPVDRAHIAAVCASSRPRSVDGSYMPCFNVGMGSAKQIAHCLNVPFYEQSHQKGHVAAALYSAGQTGLFQRSFIAFHVSGGTTEALLVSPDDKELIRCELIARSLDLKAGQAIDRVGVALGLDFPCGGELDLLARSSVAGFRIRPALKGNDCCLSGVQNKCEQMINEGCPREDVALYCILYIKETLSQMTGRLLDKYGEIPLVFAGGVMCNSMIKKEFSERFGAFFAQPQYSSDNAAGIAYLGFLKHKNRS